MKFAVQHSLLPGATLTERFLNAAKYGFEGVEVVAWGFPDALTNHKDEVVEAVRVSGLPVSSLCTMGGDDFVHPDLAERKKRLDGLVATLEMAEVVGAAGVVALPIRNPNRLADLSPVLDERELIAQVAVYQLSEALARTEGLKAGIFLEPLNRYEASYLKTLKQGTDLCERVGHPRLKILADFFHMSIEEADMSMSLTEAGARVGEVHLADSNRLLPGHGHTDFVPLLRTLNTLGYEGWGALECSVPGDKTVTLPECAAFLKSCREQAKGA